MKKQERAHVENGTAKTYTDTFIYDFVGNKTEERAARAYDENWSNRQWTSITDYNYAGKPVKVYNVNGDYTTTAYDVLGKVTAVTDIKGNKSNPVYSTTYTYDSLGRALTERIPFESVNGTVYYTVKKHYYDNRGNTVSERVTVNKPGQEESWSRTDYEYNSRNRLGIGIKVIQVCLRERN